MAQPFFRPEVMQARRGSWLGSVSLAQPPGFRLLVAAAAALALVMIAFLCFGSYTQRAHAVGRLLPVHSAGPHQARLLVPSRSIAFIGPGDEVWMRYDAFPFQKFGHQAGRVLRVADLPATRIERASLGAAPAGGESLYQVVVALDQPWVTADGERHALKSGIGVQAEILGERRRLLGWLMEPVRPPADRGGPRKLAP